MTRRIRPAYQDFTRELTYIYIYLFLPLLFNTWGHRTARNRVGIDLPPCQECIRELIYTRYCISFFSCHFVYLVRGGIGVQTPIMKAIFRCKERWVSTEVLAFSNGRFLDNG